MEVLIEDPAENLKKGTKKRLEEFHLVRLCGVLILNLICVTIAFCTFLLLRTFYNIS